MLLKAFYAYALVGGLLAAPLGTGWRHFLQGCPRRAYLLYTASLHLVFLLLLPFTFPHAMYADSYMSRNFVLQWAFGLTSLTRIIALLTGVFQMWSKRKKLLELGEAFLRHSRKCKKLEDHSAGYTHLWRRIRGLLRQQFLVLNLSVLVGTILLMHIDTNQHFSAILMIVVHVLQFIYVLVMAASIYVILLLLHWQEERVNLALQGLSTSLHHEERNALIMSGTKASKSLKILRNLFQLHAENQRLIRESFKISDLPIAMLLLKMFVTNVNLVYHAVQFANDSIETTFFTKFIGQLVVMSHYWSAVLLMNIVDDVARRNGIKKGQILRQFSDLELVQRDFQVELELFSDHLRCHPVTYKVCGLFVFNKQTSLVYFFFVLVQVLVLVQFDLKNKVEERYQKN
ncbi:hypothetical protein KR009_008342 [Drosophila setifemur]|nr:hypothetical protein KR009_008342 [Drosophila setifemur]